MVCGESNLLGLNYLIISRVTHTDSKFRRRYDSHQGALQHKKKTCYQFT